MKLPKIFVPEKNLEEGIERLLKKEPVKVQPKYAKFEMIHANTYAEGIAKLKKQGRKPFTFVENVEARIADYEVNGENAELFDAWLDSITGVVYKANSTKFKIILRSSKLENIKPDFNQSFISVNYNSEQGIELDSEEGKYNQPLTREEAKDHKFWITALGGNKGLLEKYVDLWFDKTGKDKGMGIYLEGNTSQDELKGFGLYSDDNYSYVGSFYSLDYFGACFVSKAKIEGKSL